MKLPSLDSLVTRAAATFKRFPLAVTAAIAGSVCWIFLTRLPYDSIASHYYYWNIIMSCYLGMLLFIANSIYGEAYRVRRPVVILTGLAGIAVIVIYYFSLPSRFMTISFTRFVLFTVALHLLISFIPFLSKGGVNGFWQYNKVIFLRILTSALYTGVLYLGLSLALLAIEKLFNWRIRGEIYLDLWILLSGIFNTWFFLAGIPENFAELELKKEYPKGLKIFTQYVLLPLITVYLLILYAYMFKIIINAQWLVGWVSYLVIGFSVGGILSLLLIYPVRNDENNKWILIFSRFFYFALFPLIILLFLAVKRRISDYGITEQRYFVLMLALWLLLIACYFLFSSSKNIKLIPVSLCILALAASFGPWGAFSISLSSQKKHLSSLLQKYAMLTHGKIVAAKDTLPFKDHKQISSIINYLVGVHGYKALQPYFVQNLDSVSRNTTYYNNIADGTPSSNNMMVDKIHVMMNITYVADYQLSEERKISSYMNFYTATSDTAINIGGYDYFIADFNLEAYEQKDTVCSSYLLGKNEVFVCTGYGKKLLSIFKGNEKDSVLSFDISSFAASLQKENDNNSSVPAQKMTLTSGNAALRAKLIIKNIRFRKQNDAIDELGLTANIFIGAR